MLSQIKVSKNVVRFDFSGELASTHRLKVSEGEICGWILVHIYLIELLNVDHINLENGVILELSCVVIAGDEALDPIVECGNFFHCVNSNVCIDQSQVCNFHTDCPLGEDEGLICGEFQLLILYSFTLITRLILKV